MSFKDYFSSQSEGYSKYRPGYPNELFNYLSSLTIEHDLAWDCATGNGQTARSLLPYYKRIYATDASKNQIQAAEPHQNIIFSVERAEQSHLETESVDLITVSQAVHWFHHQEFYGEVNRVLKPGGVIALWGYDLMRTKTSVDEVIREYYENIVGSYWPPERNYVDEKYANLPFPFQEMNPPQLELKTEWTFQHLIGYLNTWSAVKRYCDNQGSNPLDLIIEDLKKSWGDLESTQIILWPLFYKIGRKTDVL